MKSVSPKCRAADASARALGFWVCFVFFGFSSLLTLNPDSMCVSRAQRRIWAGPPRSGGSPTFWGFGFCLPLSSCAPPSDASSWSTSSHSGLDRAGCRVSFIKGTTFPSVITSLCLQFLPHGPLLCSDQLGTQANWTLSPGSGPIWLSPAHKRSSFTLPAACPPAPSPAAVPSEAVRSHRRSWGWSSPRKRAVKLQFYLMAAIF